jgi:hypothetical protein
VHLVVKDSMDRWRHLEKVKLDQQRDCVVFQLDESVQRYGTFLLFAFLADHFYEIVCYCYHRLVSK